MFSNRWPNSFIMNNLYTPYVGKDTIKTEILPHLSVVKRSFILHIYHSILDIKYFSESLDYIT